MNTQTKPRYSSKELSDQLTQHIQELAEATDAARLSEAMQRYLDSCAKFHQYSAHNVWLILISKPDATLVAGFHKWKSMGRYVYKGEKGIPILAPILVSSKNGNDEEDDMLVGFKVVYVFDVSQTDGEPLPEPPDWKSPANNAELNKKLIQFAESKGIQVTFRELAGETQGFSMGGRIEISPKAGTKTLIHEIAHELMHQGDESRPSKSIMELEAESVAYVVSKHFGIGGLASPNYVALHGADAELIMAHLERIRRTAGQIIRGIEL